jgi:hypothetical protein
MIVLGSIRWSAKSKRSARISGSAAPKILASLGKDSSGPSAMGELTDTFDCGAAAVFFATLQNGMSLLARDGGGEAALMAVARSGSPALEGMIRDYRRGSIAASAFCVNAGYTTGWTYAEQGSRRSVRLCVRSVGGSFSRRSRR